MSLPIVGEYNAFNENTEDRVTILCQSGPKVSVFSLLGIFNTAFFSVGKVVVTSELPTRILSEWMSPWITPAPRMDSSVDRAELLIVKRSISIENEQITKPTTQRLSAFSPDQRSELPHRA